MPVLCKMCDEEFAVFRNRLVGIFCVKSVKKKTIKVSWKKVKNAKTYQIKVGNKTYKSTKTSKKIKNKKFKKGKKVKVKVRATATGYTTGAWSKTVKKKLTK